jgi:hypothetical protein
MFNKRTPHPEEDFPTEKVTHLDQKITEEILTDGSSKKFAGNLSNYTTSQPHF